MKEIPNYPGYYVTETGEVYSNKSGKYLKQKVTNKGYKRVRLYSGKSITPAVHRIVAEAFIPNPLNLPEVDHKDEDKTNNNVSNLQWITTQANSEKEHAKHYIVEHIVSGETFEVYNLNKWCKERGISSSGLNKTIGPKKRCNHHKGFRLIQRHTRKRTHG